MTPAKAPRRRRGEGQWALGYHEPLNKNEENKKNDDGLNVRQRIIDIYSKQGFDSIDPADLRGRFRWWGLYTQRRPGISGGRTGALTFETDKVTHRNIAIASMSIATAGYLIMLFGNH